MKITSFAALVITSSLIAANAFATDAAAPTPTPADHPKGERPHDGHFKKADANGDGAISKEEWHAKSEQKFMERDANHDGKITEDEMKAHHEAMRAKRAARHAEKEKLRAAQPAKVPVKNLPAAGQ